MENVTPPFDSSNGSAALVRQFGYVGQNPYVSQRVINETADAITSQLEKKYILNDTHILACNESKSE